MVLSTLRIVRLKRQRSTSLPGGSEVVGVSCTQYWSGATVDRRGVAAVFGG